MNPVWQRIADMLGRSFGRQRVVFRPALHALARRLTSVAKPSVVDGSMALSQWFETGDRLVKVDYDERAFSNQDTIIDQLYSYDPVYDLAMAAADHELERDPERGPSGFAGELVQAFEAASGRTVDPERWFLYQWLNLVSQQSFVRSLHEEVEAGAIPRRGLESLTPLAVEEMADRTWRALARLDQQYLAARLWPERAAPAVGSLCAIDIDGVLETGRRGHSSANPCGVLALRALSLHGYVPVLVTGRSAGEVIDRCRAFHLAGGVAEYGAVAYERRSGRLIELLEPEEVEALDAMRQSLRLTPNVHIDSGYRRVVRASLLVGGSRAPLPDELVDRVLAGLDLEWKVRAVHGLAQTDLVIQRVDKGSGVRALAAALRPEADRSPVLAFAVGDSAPDLRLFAEARAWYAPSNSDSAVKASGARVMPGRHQAGLGQAVADVIGHAPGMCAVCRPPRLTKDADLLLTALAASDAGRWSKLARGLRLTGGMARG
jgi:hydroxymethylpyrimidine pyrophosphatase-like HAD family hydrolase